MNDTNTEGSETVVHSFRLSSSEKKHLVLVAAAQKNLQLHQSTRSDKAPKQGEKKKIAATNSHGSGKKLKCFIYGKLQLTVIEISE